MASAAGLHVSMQHASGALNRLLCDMLKLSISPICVYMALCQRMIHSLTLLCSQLYRCVFRIVGRGVVRQRAALEAGWRRYVEHVWSNPCVAAKH